MEWIDVLCSGVYVDTLQSVAGCDSIVTLDLTINGSYVSDDTQFRYVQGTVHYWLVVIRL